MNTNNMTRAEAYAAIKANNLQAECVKKFGKNFTMCKTADLISLVEKAGKKAAPASAPKAKTKKPATTPVKKEKVEEAPICADAPTPETPTEVVDTKARATISRLAEMPYDNNSIESDEKDEILGGKAVIAVASPVEEDKDSESPYTDEEIAEMMSFVK